MKEWANAALEHSGLKQADLARLLAEKFGWSDNRSILNKVLSGERDLKADEMISLSQATGYPLPGNTQPAAEPGLRRVEVAAHVQAGHWEETWEWEYSEKYPVYIPDLPELRGLRLYAAETRGPSMNKRYPEKTVVVFNDVQETGEQPIPGKRYVVERRRVSGECEHTVKLMAADATGKLWLMPESDDPRFQAPISIDEGTGDGDTVVILGRVVFSVTRE